MAERAGVQEYTLAGRVGDHNREKETGEPGSRIPGTVRSGIHALGGDCVHVVPVNPKRAR